MKLKYILPALALATAATSWAVPARRGVRTVTQPDGTTIQVRVVGDEFAHYTLNTDGDILVRDAKGYLCYGSVDAAGVQTASSVRADIDPESFAAKSVKQNIKTLKTERLNTRARTRRKARAVGQMPSRAASHSGMGHTGSTFPPTGDVRGLVILVEYSDVKFNTKYDAGQYFTDMLNKDGFSQYNGTGCAAEYFRLSSNNQFRPTFDVLGPVTLDYKQAYYGGNDSYGNDKNPEDMVVHAVRKLDDTVDFSKYDMDGDGEIDNIFIFYAGQGEASYGSDNTVWPHSWELSSAGKTFKVDGVRVNHYACSNEWEQSRPDGAGTFIHEFSHVMGLPDLYTTDYSQAETLTPGAYSVLDYGPYNNNGCTPPIYSAYERNAMGWIEPIVIEEKDPQTITLDHIETSNQCCLIPTKTATEFYLLENRQQTGWDKYIPGHGMLVWHVDYVQSVFNSNVVNNTVSHQYVDIIEAGGTANNQSAAEMARYPFPGTRGVTSLTSSTTPALKDWAGNAIDAPITDITEDAGIITFNVSGGGSTLERPVTATPSDISATHFTAVWNPVQGASDYLLTVTAIPEGESKTHTADFPAGSSTKVCTLPAGWTSSTTAGYDSEGNYGQAAPSLKLAASGAYVETPAFGADVTSISFWAKGNAMSNSSLQVQGSIGGIWKTLATYSSNDISNTQGATFTIDGNMPAGVRAVRFEYTKSRGNVGIDDIVINTGAMPYILAGYDKVSTSGATQMRVAAAQGINKYSYTVIAVDGNSRSRASEPMTVNLTGNAVSDITADDATDTPAQYFNLQGMRVSASQLTPGLYIERRGKSVRKVIVK